MFAQVNLDPDLKILFASGGYPHILNSDNILQAKISAKFRGSYRYKLDSFYNLGRNVGTFRSLVYFVEESKNLVRCNLESLQQQVNQHPPQKNAEEELQVEVVSQNVEEFTIDRKNGSLWTLTTEGDVEELGGKSRLDG